MTERGTIHIVQFPDQEGGNLELHVLTDAQWVDWLGYATRNNVTGFTHIATRTLTLDEMMKIDQSIFETWAETQARLKLETFLSEQK